METKHSVEQLLETHSQHMSRDTVLREQVRGWVSGEQTRSRRRERRFALVMVLAFVFTIVGFGFALEHRMAQVRTLVDRRPSRAMIELEACTFELCDSKPAEILVQQLYSISKATRLSRDLSSLRTQRFN